MDVLESFQTNPYDGSSHSLNLAVMFLDNSRVFPALTDDLRKILKIECICEWLFQRISQK